MFYLFLNLNNYPNIKPKAINPAPTIKAPSWAIRAAGIAPNRAANNAAPATRTLTGASRARASNRPTTTTTTTIAAP